MGIINRSTKIDYANEVNTDGVITQKELLVATENHLTQYHSLEKSTIISDNMIFTYNAVIQKYVSDQIFSLSFFDNGYVKDIYLNSGIGIRSNYLPKAVPSNKSFLISSIQYNTYYPVQGKLFSIEDENKNIIYTADQKVPSKKGIFENINLIISKRVGLAVYNNNIITRNPLVEVCCRIIYES